VLANASWRLAASGGSVSGAAAPSVFAPQGSYALDQRPDARTSSPMTTMQTPAIRSTNTADRSSSKRLEVGSVKGTVAIVSSDIGQLFPGQPATQGYDTDP
jgi:hypothetical protein